MIAALLTGAALGLSVAAPFGPVSLICVQQSLSRDYRYGMVSGLGAATSHGIFATVATVGAGAISVALTPWSESLHMLSALILIGLGVRTILRARSVAKVARDITMPAAYASTLILGLTNPMTIIPYLALATVAAEQRAGNSPFTLWSIPGVIIAAATWYTCLSLVAAFMARGIGTGMARVLNFLAGGSLIVFGAIVGRKLLLF